LLVSAATLAAAALVAAALSPTRALPRAAAQAAGLNGTWVLAGDPTQAEAMISQTIEPALITMAPDLLPAARARLAETTWVPSTITIDASPARIAIGFVGAERRNFDTAPGQPENVYTRSGVRAQLTQNFRPDGSVQQQFVAMDGTQWHVLSADGGGQSMTLDVVLRSQRLAREITFRLTYQRAG
jgi:hypothetical protein